MKAIKNILMLAVFSGIANLVNAQSNESTVGAFMRSNERSYVVIAVMVTILTGLILYIVRIDRKISRLEKEK
jgi:MFS superfamily sulfate permease-like transporter